MLKYIFILFTLSNYQNVNAHYKDSTLNNKAEKIHKKILTIDSHADTPMHFSNKVIDLNNYNTNIKVDLKKMEKGGLDGIFFIVFLEQGPRDEAGYIIAKNKALSLLKSIKTKVNKYPDKAQIITSPIDAYKLKKQNKKAIFIGIENGYCIGKDLHNILKIKQLGANYITLSHTKNNDICDSSTDRCEHNGLSNFGIKVVKEMNRLGIMIDISHTSDKTVRDVIKLSKSPVIASHSCAQALTNNKRNLSNDLIKLIAKNGGVIQVCFVSRFLKPTPLGKASVSDLVNHIDHIVNIVGIDHVGIGSDFDGGGSIIGCRDVSEIKNITIELLKRNYTEEDIEKIWSGNLLRVMTDVQNLAN